MFIFIREVFSFYISLTGNYYHLHREFLVVNEGCEIATICTQCNADIAKGIIPKYSIAAGVDFGNPARIGLAPLTLVEQYCISPCRLYASIVKLCGRQPSEQQTASKGHVITIRHENQAALEAIVKSRKEKSDTSTYPNLDGIEEFISVVFVKGKLQADSMVPSPVPVVQELKINPDKMFKWLRMLLKAVNPDFRLIEIDDSGKMRDLLNDLSESLLNEAAVVEDAMGSTIEKLVPQETVPPPFGYNNPEAYNSVDESLPLDSVFLTQSQPPLTDIHAPSVTLLNGKNLSFFR